MKRLHLDEVVVVEGRYDAAALEGVVDALILTTDGFSIFNDEEKKQLLRRLGKQRGLLVLTDSDAAGFAIRRHLEQVAGGCVVKHAYIPAVRGKEGRKAAPSKEGTLGVEGLPPEVLREALRAAGVQEAAPRAGRGITYTDLYELGLSGTQGAAQRRREALERLGLPPRLSKKALAEVLGRLYTYEELAAALGPKPALFWDFHGTLTLPDIVWFAAAAAAVEEAAPGCGVGRAEIERAFSRTCLPWWELPGGDTRTVRGTAAWWAFCERNFAQMLVRAGLAGPDAERAAPLLRKHVLRPGSYTLYPDAIPTLRTLQKRGYKSYILSNNFPELGAVVRGLGLAPYLAGVVTSGEVGYEKPRAEIFTAALATVGGPAGAWMIGDSVREDIEGGNAAGLVTVAVHGAQGPAAHCVQALAQLLPLLP